MRGYFKKIMAHKVTDKEFALALIVAMLVGVLLFLTSCGAIGGTIDFGFIKIPTFLILGVIVVYIIYRRNQKK